MNCLDRYFGVSILRGLLATAVIVGTLVSFIDLLATLEDIGDGFGVGTVIAVTVLNLPGRLIELLPIIMLIGALVPIGLLADGAEITAMRAAGISVARIVIAVLKSVVLILLIAMVLAQWVTPRLDAAARELRGETLYGEDVSRGERGFWSREGSRFLNVGMVRYGRVPLDVEIYEFDDAGRLVHYIYAAEAELQDDRRWRLRGVHEKRAVGRGFELADHDELMWNAFLDAGQLGLLVVPPETLPPIQLWRYVGDLRDRGQAYDNFETLLWRRLVMPFSALSLVLVALPFTFGSSRAVGVSRRLIWATGVGVVFYFGSEILRQFGLLEGLAAPLVALLPPLLTTLAGLALLRRVR